MPLHNSKRLLLILLILCGVFTSSAQDCFLKPVTALCAALKENSGLVYGKRGLWTLNDGPSVMLYRLDEHTGGIVQQVCINGITTTDTEAMADDGEFVYVGDVGNNHAPRNSFTILKIRKAAISPAEYQEVSADTITFNYEDFGGVNFDSSIRQFDCEAMICFKNHLYLFTKRKCDQQTIVYKLSARPGMQQARKLAVLDCKGLITDATINAQGNKLALVGYLPGHMKPFMWVFSSFTKDHFFSGKQQRIELPGAGINWQVEGVAFKTDEELYVSCEQTLQVGCQLYTVSLKK